MTNSIEELMEDMACRVAEQDNDQGYQAQPGEHLKLIKLHGLLLKKNEFHVGDLVEWKMGLKNKNMSYKKLMVVTKIYEKPMSDNTIDAGSSYFSEQLDIVCANMLNGSFLEYHYDSRRLQPYVPERKEND